MCARVVGMHIYTHRYEWWICGDALTAQEYKQKKAYQAKKDEDTVDDEIASRKAKAIMANVNEREEGRYGDSIVMALTKDYVTSFLHQIVFVVLVCPSILFPPSCSPCQTKITWWSPETETSGSVALSIQLLW